MDTVDYLLREPERTAWEESHVRGALCLCSYEDEPPGGYEGRRRYKVLVLINHQVGQTHSESDEDLKRNRSIKFQQVSTGPKKRNDVSGMLLFNNKLLVPSDCMGYNSYK